MRRAEADRGLEIGAHPHAEFVDAVALCDLAQQREMQGRFLMLRRDAHQPDDRQAEPAAAIGDERIGRFRQHAGFLPLLADIHFDEARKTPAAPLHLARQRLGEAQPVDGLDNVAMRDRVLDLVGLQRPDQMQNQIRKIAAQSGKLRERLLDTVFAEHPLPGGKRGAHAVRRMRLADRDQRRRIRGPACGARGAFNAAAHGTQVGANLLHNGTSSITAPFLAQGVPKAAAGQATAPRDCMMSVRYYRLLPAFAASLSLLLPALLGGCGSNRAESDAGGPRPTAVQAASSKPDEIDTESNIRTVLRMAKRPSPRNPSPP